MEIVKAEILWSRKCSLKCSYCAMVNDKGNSPTLDQWKEGIRQLKKLGCKFIAIYGAEPLLEFKKLPEVIYYARLLDIDVTVITSGVVPELTNKLRTLYDFGLRSITTSFDMVDTMGNSSLTKSNRALSVIDRFRSFGYVDNVAVVATLTAKNFKRLPQTIKDMTDKNIWTFFDMIHSDRGQPGSKVSNVNPDLMFSKDDFKELSEVLIQVIELKKRGYLCHASEIFLNKLIATEPDIYEWHCVKENSFPAWVTVDCNGEVLPCDDFNPNLLIPFYVWNIYDEWGMFCQTQKYTVKRCSGCCWNTHIDACAIKEGKLPLTDYIHER